MPHCPLAGTGTVGPARQKQTVTALELGVTSILPATLALGASNEKARMMRASSEGVMGSEPSKLLIYQPKSTR